MLSPWQAYQDLPGYEWSETGLQAQRESTRTGLTPPTRINGMLASIYSAYQELKLQPKSEAYKLRFKLMIDEQAQAVSDTSRLQRLIMQSCRL